VRVLHSLNLLIPSMTVQKTYTLSFVDEQQKDLFEAAFNDWLKSYQKIATYYTMVPPPEDPNALLYVDFIPGI
jgi:hypothetical protein